MLRSYFTSDEKIYLYNSFKGERYAKKDTFLFVIGLLFGLVAVASLILAFLFGWTLLIPFFIGTIVAYGLLRFYFKINRLHLTKNENIYIEYAITNKRFMFIEKNNQNFLEIPLTSFSKFVVRSTYAQVNVQSFILRLENFYLPIQVDNDVIQISNDGIVIQDVVGAFILKKRLEFLLYLEKNGIDDIYDIDNFLELGEYVVYSENYKNTHMVNELDEKSKNFINIGIIICILYFAGSFVDGLENLGSLLYYFVLIFIVFIIRKRAAIKDYFKTKMASLGSNAKAPKMYNCNLRYVITNKRVLFFDFNSTILYAFKFDELEFVNVSNYDSSTDVGDIYLSDMRYSNYIKRHTRHSNSSTNYYADFFPDNYFNHKILIDMDIMNCCKIRLYKVKNPNSVIENFIIRHVKDKDKNKNT